MYPRIQELLDYVDAQRRVLREAFESVPPALREDALAPGQWSASGVIEHLAIVAGRIATLVRRRVDEARAAGVGLETSSEPILPHLNVERVIDRSTRVEAPGGLHPTGIGSDAAWAALERATVSFRESVAHADGLALGEIWHPHPLLGPLSLYQWIAFFGAHEARHAAQIAEQMTESGSGPRADGTPA